MTIIEKRMDLKNRTKWAIDFVAEKENLTSGMIAKITRSSPQTIYKYQNKISNPRIKFVRKFCHAFGFNFQWLTEGFGEPFPGAGEIHLELGILERAETGRQEDIPPSIDIHQGSSPGKMLHMQDVVLNKKCEQVDLDAEMSLQKLASLLEVVLDGSWVVNLARIIGVAPQKISTAIGQGYIDSDLVQDIEALGHSREKWAVPRKEGRRDAEYKNQQYSRSNLLKIAEEVLQSGTAHATSLSMILISMEKALTENKGSSVQGVNAIKTNCRGQIYFRLSNVAERLEADIEPSRRK